MRKRESESVRNRTVEQGDWQRDGLVRKIDGSGDARARDADAAWVYVFRGFYVAENPADEVGADRAFPTPSRRVGSIVKGVVRIVTRAAARQIAIRSVPYKL